MENNFDNNNIKVGEKIKELRKQKEISLQELSNRTGFLSAVLSQIENHFISPPLGILLKIAKALDVDIGYFLEKKMKFLML